MTQIIHRLIAVSILLLSASCSREVTVTTRTREMNMMVDYENYLLGEKDYFEFNSQKEFTSRLSGRNPHGISYLEPSFYERDQEGLLIDEWGKPFQISRPEKTKLEIRSAGRDGKFGNPDDIVTVHPPEKKS